jgi:CRISPR/Cas system-associated protein endoribonuclease Cas2
MLKNITLSADEHYIELARKKALSKKETLNTAFRRWLVSYAKNNVKKSVYSKIMKELSYANSGKHFSRDELNER